MIDVRLLRTDPDGCPRRARPPRRPDAAGGSSIGRPPSTTRLREHHRRARRLRARVNELSKQVGQLRRDGETAERRGAPGREPHARRAREAARPRSTTRSSSSCAELLLRIPNLPHPDAPDGTSDADNPVVKGPFNLPDVVRRAPARAALGDGDRRSASSTTSGRPRSPGRCSRCSAASAPRSARALCQLALDRNADAFEEIRPPSLVSTATLTATGQLPKFADDAFAIERDDLWCIPTAEVPLTSIYAGEILDEAELPVRMMAYTPCYRREAGSAGRDTRGMLRAHEFDKVEILAFATPEQAPGAARRDGRPGRGARSPRSASPYRIIEICTGDLGQSHHRSFDIEVYAPGVDQWLEVSSISWFSDYQARRANIRYRPVDATAAAEGHGVRAHAQRLGARRAPRVGGDRRELPQGRRLDRRARGAPARTCAASARSHRMSRRRDPRPAGAVRDRRHRCRRHRRRPDGAVAAVARRRRSTPASPSRTR